MTAFHHDLKVKHIPKYFEVRWTEFSYSLFSSILFSWQAIVKYLQHTEDRSAQGHIKFLTDRTKFRTMCCVADVLQIYSRFQKAIQDNRVTYFDWDTRVCNLIEQLNKMKSTMLVGGWEYNFNENYNEEASTFFGVNLIDKQRRTNHTLVSVKRDFSAIRFEIIESLINFLEERYHLDSERVKQLHPLKKLNSEVTDEELKKCYEIIIPELDLASFALQYRDACDAFGNANMAPIEIVKSITQSGLWGRSNVT